MTEDFDRTLQRRIAQLNKSKLPERDLWPGIELAVMAKGHRRTPWLAIAASFAICVTGGWVWLARYPSSNDPMLKTVVQLDDLHQKQISALKITFKDSRSLTTNWSEQLHDLDQAAEAIKIALKNEPQNVTLLKMLSEVYQKEIDLLKTVHEPHLLNPDLI